MLNFGGVSVRICGGFGFIHLVVQYFAVITGFGVRYLFGCFSLSFWVVVIICIFGSIVIFQFIPGSIGSFSRIFCPIVDAGDNFLVVIRWMVFV